MDAVKKLVSGRLKGQLAGPHPDPELLAAFAENDLPRHDRPGLLNHLAVCTRCRELLYLALPDTTEAQQVLALPSPRPRLAARWATLAASVVILASVLVTNRGVFNRHPTGLHPITETRTEKIAELKTPPEVNQIGQAPAIEAAAKVRAPLKHMTAKPQASMQFDQSGQVHLAAAPTMSSADSASAARISVAGAAVSVAALSWSLASDGQVQRSVDSGKTWQIVPVVDGLSFHAISSVAGDVWVGGKAGALYHSADSGQNWKKAEFVSTNDITHIEFSDQQNGMVSTANGQTWSTSDGGRSWRLK